VTLGIIASIIVVVFIAGNLLGGLVVAGRIADNSEAIAELREVSIAQDEGAQRGTAILDLLCLLINTRMADPTNPIPITPEILALIEESCDPLPIPSEPG
jgi:hypothetical protein